MHTTVGRAPELAAAEALVRDVGPSLRALILEGDAGIGKTTVWLHGVSAARDAGLLVLVARPASGEAAMPFAALGDLFEGVVGQASGLPQGQREAIQLALDGASPETATRVAVARATLALLRDLGERSPVLLAIDDVQWLDPSTENALEFAVRRLGSTAVRVLVSRRSESTMPLPLGLAQHPPDRVQRLRLGPLSPGDVGELLREGTGLRLPRPRLLELHETCGGNPFYAMEIGRILAAAGPLPPDAPLPLPASLGELLRRRLEALSPAARDAVLLAAASPHSGASIVQRAAGTTEGLEEAVRSNVLEIDAHRMRFSHPLLASTAYAAAFPWERRDAHRRLAEAVDTSLDRAHHLSRATELPDEDVAATLELAAAEAAARGAPEIAADLAEHAARLTPPEHAAAQRRRRSEAARHHIAAGDPARGRATLRDLVAGAQPGRERADLLWRLADAGEIDLDESIALAKQALAEAADDASLSSEIETALGIFTWMMGDFELSAAHAREAVRHAERAADPERLAIAIAELCHIRVVLGEAIDEAAMARAMDLERDIPTFPPYQRPSFQLGILRMYRDEPDAARPLLEAELERIRAQGDEAARCGVYFRLAELELRAGDWARAARHSRDAMALAKQAGIEQEQATCIMMHGTLQAHLGNLEEAERAASEALQLARATGDLMVEVRSMGALGFVELSRDHPDAALEWLGPARRTMFRVGAGELSISQVANHELDALIALERLDEAEEVLAYIEAKGAISNRAWHAAVAGRGRALVASARGDAEAARAHLAAALAAHDRLPQPFELARTLLALGQVERRAKRRAEARQALTRALEIFDTLGAPRWSEKAAAELARIPGRGPGPATLTETERRIAELVAAGLSNKEVAARLFITVRTVESTLSRVYEKVGVRSRTELASRSDLRA